VRVSFALVIDPTRIAADVQTAVAAALVDPDAGLFGANRVGIGEAIYVSRIYQACLSVPGALAVERLAVGTGASSTPSSGFRLDPGEGGYLSLALADLDITAEAAHGA